MSATLGGILHLVAAAVRFARSRWCDPKGAEPRCQGCWIDAQQLGGAALAISETIGPPQRFHQIRTVALLRNWQSVKMTSDMSDAEAESQSSSAHAMSRRFACDVEK